MERIDKVVQVCAGGDERALSVRNGLDALAEAGTWDLVGVHDGARPLVTCDEITRAVEALAADERLGGAVLGVPSTDTVKIVDEDGVIVATPERRTVWRAQTPQIFRWQALMDAYAADAGRGAAALPPTTPRWWRRAGAGWPWSRARPRTSRSPTGSTCATPSRSWRSADVTESAAGASSTGHGGPAFRVGLGFDAHRFAPDRPLVLGGVRLREHDGLLGHSDADVLAHAVMDALLGAAGLEDIGHYFPDTDPAFAGADSMALLAAVVVLLRDRGWRAGQRGRGGHLRRAAHRAPPGTACASAWRRRWGSSVEAVGMRGHHHRGHGLHRAARRDRRAGGGPGRENRRRRELRSVT